MKTANAKRRRAGGRPAKFDEPSRPVTVTLPERIIDRLREIDPDRARAIVKAVDALPGRNDSSLFKVDVVGTAPGAGFLLVPANHSLAAIPWLRMIEVAPSRYLLAVEPGTAIEKLEVALTDLIEQAGNEWPLEVPMLEELRSKFTEMRRGERISKSEILLVATAGG